MVGGGWGWGGVFGGGCQLFFKSDLVVRVGVFGLAAKSPRGMHT